MELLIPGLILVALMIYASTRIKRTAAEAFDAETVETDEFTIRKAEGFLNVIGGDPRYAFEAYSRDFGTGDAEEIRRATVRLRVHQGGSVAAADEIKAAVRTVVADASEVVGGTRYRILELDGTEDGIGMRIFHKLAERAEKVYDLEITVLTETTDEFMRNIETMLNSFEVK